MNRRTFLANLAALAGFSLVPMARAGVLDSISSPEATQALRDSLVQGAKKALLKLGQENGYFNNPSIKIGLPKNYAKADRLLRTLGQGKKVDALVLSMNRAAEMAAPKAEALVIDAAKKMTVQDAKDILTGGDNAVTEYFRKTTEVQLGNELMPVIKSVVDQSGLARAYNTLAAKLVQLAGLESKQATVEDYVRQKALDGIYAMIGEEERAMRANPTQYAGGLIGKVFGLIK